MVNIGIFSDSHGDLNSLSRLLYSMGSLDAVLFLGDVARDSDWLSAQLEHWPAPPEFYAVRGNNDLASGLPDELVVKIGGKRIFMTHGHLYHVRSGTEELVDRALECHAEVALYGHTHEAYVAAERGVLVINPGAAGNPWGCHRARAVKLIVDGEHMRVEDVIAGEAF